MTHTTITPVPVSFDDAGHGEPALVYLTGWCAARTTYAAMVEHTARYRRSIAIDWRGHGTSPAAEGVRPAAAVSNRMSVASPATAATRVSRAACAERMPRRRLTESR